MFFSIRARCLCTPRHHECCLSVERDRRESRLASSFVLSKGLCRRSSCDRNISYSLSRDMTQHGDRSAVPFSLWSVPCDRGSPTRHKRALSEVGLRCLSQLRAALPSHGQDGRYRGNGLCGYSGFLSVRTNFGGQLDVQIVPFRSGLFIAWEQVTVHVQRAQNTLARLRRGVADDGSNDRSRCEVLAGSASNVICVSGLQPS
jgi:hypothetical protein